MSVEVELAYGRGKLRVGIPCSDVSVIQPKETPAVANEAQALRAALNAPVGCPALPKWFSAKSRVCITFSDITRATPNERIIPQLLEYLKQHGARPENILLLNGTGTHRPNSRDELKKLLTPEVLATYRVLNHDCKKDEDLVEVGKTRQGVPALLNRHFVTADLRIVTGFIEPHFFAGFSGGPKGVMPAVAGLRTIMANHSAKHIAHERANFGILEGNPIWEEMRDLALLAGPSFLLNVTLDSRRRITGVFAGDLIKAHRKGTNFVRTMSMQRVDRPFEIVLTSNSGYPLDQNLYQATKGMKAAAQIVADGGTVIVAAECREGVPTRSPHDLLLRQRKSVGELLELIDSPGFEWPEQWATHVQILIQRRAEIALYSSLAPSVVRNAHLQPCSNVTEMIAQRLAKFGPKARVAVLPYGPLTIPFLHESTARH